jgi:hypothetical protein
MSVYWVLADASTGEILRWGVSPEADVPSGAILGEGTVKTHYVSAGELVAYTPEQASAKAVAPLGWPWSNMTMMAADPRALSDFKTAKVAEMKAARDAFALGTFQAAGFVFASDASSQTRIMLGFTKAQLQGAGFSEQWLLADGSVRTLTAANMQTLILALWDHIKLADTTLYTRTQQIAAAQTIPDVQSIVW